MTLIEKISRQLAIEAVAESVLEVSDDPSLPIAVKHWMDGYAQGLLAARIRVPDTHGSEYQSPLPPPPEAYPIATGLTPAGMPYPVGGIAGHALNEIAEGDGVLLPNTGDGPPRVCREYPGTGSALLYQRGHLPCRCDTNDVCQLAGRQGEQYTDTRESQLPQPGGKVEITPGTWLTPAGTPPQQDEGT